MHFSLVCGIKQSSQASSWLTYRRKKKCYYPGNAKMRCISGERFNCRNRVQRLQHHSVLSTENLKKKKKHNENHRTALTVNPFYSHLIRFVRFIWDFETIKFRNLSVQMYIDISRLRHVLRMLRRRSWNDGRTTAGTVMPDQLHHSPIYEEDWDEL